MRFRESMRQIYRRIYWRVFIRDTMIFTGIALALMVIDSFISIGFPWTYYGAVLVFLAFREKRWFKEKGSEN